MKKMLLPCLMLGICMMMYGYVRGEVATLHEKAVAICLECVGIG